MERLETLEWYQKHLTQMTVDALDISLSLEKNCCGEQLKLCVITVLDENVTSL